MDTFFWIVIPLRNNSIQRRNHVLTIVPKHPIWNRIPVILEPIPMAWIKGTDTLPEIGGHIQHIIKVAFKHDVPQPSPGVMILWQAVN